MTSSAPQPTQHRTAEVALTGEQAQRCAVAVREVLTDARRFYEPARYTNSTVDFFVWAAQQLLDSLTADAGRDPDETATIRITLQQADAAAKILRGSIRKADLAWRKAVAVPRSRFDAAYSALVGAPIQEPADA